MKEIKEHSLKEISGAGLASDIMNFFRNGTFGSGSDTVIEHKPWVSDISSAATGKGEEYGLALVTGLVAIAAFVAAGINWFSGK